MADVDIRPRIVFQTSVGAVIGVVDPQSILAGTITFPSPLNVIPYTIVPGFPVSTITFTAPTGPYTVPLDVSALLSGSSQSGVVSIPGFGEVPYYFTLGDPPIPYSERFAGSADILSLVGGFSPWLLVVVGGVIAWSLWRRR